MIRKSLIALLLAAAGLAIALVAIMLTRPSRQLVVPPVQPVAVDARAAADRLAAAVRIPTVSVESGKVAEPAQFLKLHQHLADSFPKLHAALRREVIGDYSLLYTWPGRNAQAPAVMLMAHQDVVPIAPGTEKAWQGDPFSGEIRDGFVWGRGAWDDKGSLMAILEAVELLVSQGFVPARTIHLAFGHDEEVGGRHGAARIAERIRERGSRLAMVLDEGMLITDGMIDGLSAPAAIIGVAEKGTLTLRLTATGEPGHSSMPPARTAIGTLARAVARVEANPLPARLSGLPREMFETLAPEMSGVNGLLLSNLWLFEPVVRQVMQKKPNTNTVLRTTTAPTVLSAGNKENVLPGEAVALFNFRLLPGDSIAGVIAHVSAAVDDPSIRIEALPGGTEPSPVSASGAAGYQAIARTLRELSPTLVVAPGLMIAATDSRHFADIADNVYRFMPVRARAEDLARFHGTNERMSVANYAQIIQFYHRLIGNLDALR
jgi:carboxypeptidase PM20D1